MFIFKLKSCLKKKGMWYSSWDYYSIIIPDSREYLLDMFVGDGEASVHTSMYNKTEQDNKTNELQQESDQNRDDSNGAASPTPGDCQLLRRLQADVNSLSLVNAEQSQVCTVIYYE